MREIIESNEFYYIIELKKEYTGWTGEEKYAIVTDLEQNYIEVTFADELSHYKPYLFLNSSHIGIFNEYDKNEEKSRYRNRKLHIPFSFEEGDSDKYHQELSVPNFDTAWIINDEIRYLLSFLTEKESYRFYAHYFLKMTLQEIADESHCSVAAIKHSVDDARKKLKKIIEK